MNSTSTHRWLATFAGIFVGSAIGWNFNYSILSLIIGATIGFAIGYFGCNLSEIPHAAARAWKEEVWGKYVKQFPKHQFLVSREGWKIIGMISVFAINIIGDILLAQFSLYSSPFTWQRGLFAMTVPSLLMECVIFVYFMEDENKTSENFFAFSALSMLAFGPLLPILLCLVFYIQAKKIVVFIHSDERLQCGTYCAIGTGIMWCLHPHSFVAVVIGAAVGATIGELVYHLVSKRFIAARTA